MQEFMEWLDREIALHDDETEGEIDTSEMNPLPEFFKAALGEVGR